MSTGTGFASCHACQSSFHVLEKPLQASAIDGLLRRVLS